MTDQNRRLGPDEAHLDRAVEPEYAAISGWAVFALILAAIGALALLPAAYQPYLPWPTLLRYHLPILLVIPIVSGILALMAMGSIRRSGGTRVGLQPARIALGLSLLFMAGSLCYHGLHQRTEILLQDQLQAAAAGDLQDLFANNYDALLARLAANGGNVPRDKRSWIAETHYYLYDGGDYYGRKLQALEMRPVEVSPEQTRLDGMAVYRLTFKEWTLDLRLQYVRMNDEWKLVSMEGAGNPMTAPKEGVQPKPRFE
jgi:hypothetical protein